MGAGHRTGPGGALISDGSTPERLLTATLEILRQRGYAAMSIKAVLHAAQALHGSLYHHFPGGKEELAAEALRRSGEAYRELIASYLRPGADVVDAVDRFFADGAEFLAAADFINMCPVASVAGEIATDNERLRAVTAAAFDSWLVAPIAAFERAGLDHDAATAVARQLLALAEGALLLARAQRDTAALDAARSAAVTITRAALARAPDHSARR